MSIEYSEEYQRIKDEYERKADEVYRQKCAELDPFNRQHQELIQPILDKYRKITNSLWDEYQTNIDKLRKKLATEEEKNKAIELLRTLGYTVIEEHD